MCAAYGIAALLIDISTSDNIFGPAGFSSPILRSVIGEAGSPSSRSDSLAGARPELVNDRWARAAKIRFLTY